MTLLLRAFPLLLLLTASALVPSARAQATPDAPPQVNLPKQAPLNPALPTVFIVGDSTASNGPDLGWGDHFAPLFDTSKINVANRARAGRSSRTYINEGLWAKTLSQMKPGDYMLFQMGHNDGGDLGGPKPRGEIKGIGDESKDVPQTAGPLAGTVETVHTYGWYVRKYVAEARAKGVTPILLTPTIRNIWSDGPDGKPHIEHDMGYHDYIYALGKELNVPVADMAAREAAYLEDAGQKRTSLLFPIDHTHTSAEGAGLNAEFVAQSLRDIHSPLATYLKH